MQCIAFMGIAFMGIAFMGVAVMGIAFMGVAVMVLGAVGLYGTIPGSDITRAYGRCSRRFPPVHYARCGLSSDPTDDV